MMLAHIAGELVSACVRVLVLARRFYRENPPRALRACAALGALALLASPLPLLGLALYALAPLARFAR